MAGGGPRPIRGSAPGRGGSALLDLAQALAGVGGGIALGVRLDDGAQRLGGLLAAVESQESQTLLHESIGNLVPLGIHLDDPLELLGSRLEFLAGEVALTDPVQGVVGQAVTRKSGQERLE